jgi:c-di-GMP-binding flagellar brake protein YcgR
MNHPDTLPLDPDMTERCTLASPLEIIALMREVRDRRATVTLRAEDGGASLVSVILEVDARQGLVLFDASGSAARDARLAGAHCVQADAAIDNIRIHFASGPVSPLVHQGHAALATPLPLTALRMQRREEFRIETPVAEPLYCRVRETAGGQGSERLYRVHDLSTTGLALAPAAGEPAPEPGTRLEPCRLDLPGAGVLHAGLEVVDVREQKTRTGSRRIVGCRFVGLPGPQETVLQRYIIGLQRERRNRT